MRGCGNWNNKRGSITILLSVILVSTVAMAVMFSSYAKQEAEESYHASVTDIACRSVLSEYDVRLKDDYGIFAFHANENYIGQKINYYISYMDKHSQNMFSLSNVEVEADIKEYGITDISNFEKEIITAAKYKFFVPRDSSTLVTESGIELKNEAIMDSLPSNAFDAKSIDLNFSDLKAEGLKGLIAESGETFLVNSYILSVFNYKNAAAAGHESYFGYEVEYIIGGLFSDVGNLDKIRRHLVTIRTPVNIAKIYQDPERSALALAEAEALTPGPAAAATQLAIITAWAIVDAEMDAGTILDGEEVDGLSYKDYLAIMLTLQDSETKLVRMMDLMQLNLKGSYYQDFLLSEYLCGFKVDISIDGRKYHYVHTY